MKRLSLSVMALTTLLVSTLALGQAPPTGITEIRMQRFGAPLSLLPTDDLILKNSEIAYYIGKGGVQPLGINIGHIRAYKFEALVDFLESQDFFSQKDIPVPRRLHAGDGTTISVVRDGKVHRLRIGDIEAAPPALWGMMMAIRGLAADIEWNKYKGGVRGTVANISNQPPAKYFVTAQRPDESYPSFRTEVSEEGAFEINLPAGEYTLSVELVAKKSLRKIGQPLQVTVPELEMVEVQVGNGGGSQK